eukprot:TRINITY_DN13926_c0_g1_i1.p1 TRINITY_DN13926_c0_g1~~TRINITY_DN13926_c0_g1_i1.p1  ORF type:complete len:1100 (-),score=130.18 TRINITY_DN13926_c0_g1_i1:76-3375(-)
MSPSIIPKDDDPLAAPGSTSETVSPPLPLQAFGHPLSPKPPESPPPLIAEDIAIVRGNMRAATSPMNRSSDIRRVFSEGLPPIGPTQLSTETPSLPLQHRVLLPGMPSVMRPERPTELSILPVEQTSVVRTLSGEKPHIKLHSSPINVLHSPRQSRDCSKGDSPAQLHTAPRSSSKRSTRSVPCLERALSRSSSPITGRRPTLMSIPKASGRESHVDRLGALCARISGMDKSPSSRMSSPVHSMLNIGERRSSEIRGHNRVSFVSGRPGGRMSIAEALAIQTMPAQEPRLDDTMARYDKLRRRCAARCRHLVKWRPFQTLMMSILFCGLLLPDMWIIVDQPNDSVLDALIGCVFGIFLLDVIVHVVGFSRSYVGSFFFYTDVVGIFSLLAEMPYFPFSKLAGSEGKSAGDNISIVRAARVAKLGAQASRVVRLTKAFRIIPILVRTTDHCTGAAKTISSRLIMALSTRLSCLIILTVGIMPIFRLHTFPDQDWSFNAWLNILEDTAIYNPDQFSLQLTRFTEFYEEFDYFPYRLSLLPGQVLSDSVESLLPWYAPVGAPARVQSTTEISSKVFRMEINFARTNRFSSGMAIGTLMTAIAMIFFFSLHLSDSVNSIVVKPLERLTERVQGMTSKIFTSVMDMTKMMGSADEVDGMQSLDTDSDDESRDDMLTGLLEQAVQKLGILTNLVINTGDAEVDGDTLAAGDWVVSSRPLSRHSIASDFNSWGTEEEAFTMEAQTNSLESSGLSLDLLHSWQLNPLELDRVRLHAAAQFFLGGGVHKMPFDALAMVRFLEAAETGYQRCPYHRWHHAVDVTHFVYRAMQVCDADQYLLNSERFALLVSGICHDIGHPGLNNIFLVESSHELALLYNDKSPLENMHCSKLFDLVAKPTCNIFSQLNKSQLIEVRSTCIEAILHTDNSLHFAMVKDTQMFYEVNFAALGGGDGSQVFPGKDALDLLRNLASRKLLIKIFLHEADISNSMKPFRICQIWAKMVLDEFFAQGDKEKQLGLPVQALNDREKVNPPFSQVGFIEFLAFPLALAVIRVLPPTAPLLECMLNNAERWHKLWVEQTQPPPNENEKVSVEGRLEKLNIRYQQAVQG